TQLPRHGIRANKHFGAPLFRVGGEMKVDDGAVGFDGVVMRAGAEHESSEQDCAEQTDGVAGNHAPGIPPVAGGCGARKAAFGAAKNRPGDHTLSLSGIGLQMERNTRRSAEAYAERRMTSRHGMLRL